MNTFETTSFLPPSLQEQTLLGMMTTAGFLIVVLLCMQWIYALISDSIEFPSRVGHPLNISRKVQGLLVAIALLIVLPRLALMIGWNYFDGNERRNLALMSWVIILPVSILFGYAWWIARLARPVERLQLRRFPIPTVPIELRSHEKKRGAWIIAGVLVVSFATNYVRPAGVSVPRHVQHH